MSVAPISSSLPSTQPLESSITVVSACDLHPISCSSESPIWLIFSTLVFLSLLTLRTFQTWSPCSGLIATDCHSKLWVIWCHSTQLNLIQYPCLYNITWLISLTTERCLSSTHTRLSYISHTISLEVCLYAIPTVWDDLLPHQPYRKSLPFEPSPNAIISVESSWSLLLWNCYALVICHSGATPGSSIPIHFPLQPNTVFQQRQLSTNTNKHQGSCQPHDNFTSQYCLPQNLQPTSIHDDDIRTCQQEFQGQGS